MGSSSELKSERLLAEVEYLSLLRKFSTAKESYHELVNLFCEASPAFVELRASIRSRIDDLRSEMGSSLSKQLGELLNTVNWPSDASKLQHKLAAMNDSNPWLSLISIDSGYDRVICNAHVVEQSSAESLLSIDALLQPVYKRANYHFFPSSLTKGKKSSMVANAEKPEWLLNYLTTVCSTALEFIDSDLSKDALISALPASALPASALPVSTLTQYFLKKVVMIARRSLLLNIDKIFSDPMLLTHTVEQALIFDSTLIDSHGYNPVKSSDMCVGVIFAKQERVREWGRIELRCSKFTLTRNGNSSKYDWSRRNTENDDLIIPNEPSEIFAALFRSMVDKTLIIGRKEESIRADIFEILIKPFCAFFYQMMEGIVDENEINLTGLVSAVANLAGVAESACYVADVIGGKGGDLELPIIEEMRGQFLILHDNCKKSMASQLCDIVVQSMKQYLVRSHIILCQAEAVPLPLDATTGELILSTELSETAEILTTLFYVLGDLDNSLNLLGRSLCDIVSKYLAKAIITAPEISRSGIQQFRRDTNVIMEIFPQASVINQANNDKMSDLSLLKECLAIFEFEAQGEMDNVAAAIVGIIDGASTNSNGKLTDKAAQEEVWEILKAKGFFVISHEYFCNLHAKSLPLRG